MYYQQTYYKRDKNLNWKKTSSKPYYCFMPYGKWQRSAELDRKSGYQTNLEVRNTKGGLNKKVTKAVTYFNDGTKVEYDYITSSSKLPNWYLQKEKGKYKW